MTKKHQTHSFNDTVAMVASKIALDKLIPKVEESIQVNNHMITQKLTRVFMNPLAEVQLNQLALIEEIAELLGKDFKELQISLMVRKERKEDEAVGMVAQEQATEGSKVLLQVKSKQEGEAEYTNSEFIKIKSVGRKNDNGMVQTLEEIESAVVGMKLSEVKTIEIKAETEGEKGSVVEVKVLTISKAPSKDEAKAS